MHEMVLKYLNYSPDNGSFTWRISPTAPVPQGSVAGTIGKRGYRIIGFQGKIYGAHRLAFLIMTGRWPEDQIDHINLEKSDNRWCNLREATRSQNFSNVGKRSHNTSGYKGVYRHKHTGKYQTSIRLDRKLIYLGIFNTAEEAYQVYCSAATRLRGEFARYA